MEILFSAFSPFSSPSFPLYFFSSVSSSFLLTPSFIFLKCTIMSSYFSVQLLTMLELLVSILCVTSPLLYTKGAVTDMSELLKDLMTQHLLLENHM